MMSKTVWIYIILLVHFFGTQFVQAQKVVFFDEGTDSNFYDQAIVNISELGESTFEHTYPPGGGPDKWNDKVPCSGVAYKGKTSLKFNYTSAENGNWKVHIHQKDWSSADLTDFDSISFYIYSETELPNTALPLIGILTEDGESDLDTLANYNGGIPPQTWTQIKYPIDSFSGSYGLAQVKAIVLSQSEKDNSTRIVFIDELLVFKTIDQVPKIEALNISGYDSHAELSWQEPMTDLSYKIYASFDNGATFDLRTETTQTSFLDFVPQEGRNKTVIYRVIAITQGKESEQVESSVEIRDFSDEELMDMVQEYCFRYFWEGAHQGSGTSLERSNGNGNTTASGATGFQLMAMIVAHEREYRNQDEIKDRILMILDFLKTCDRHHGAWSHWYNSDTKKSVAFSPKDDGGDIVETSFVAQALIALKNYFNGSDSKSVEIRETADQLWKEIEWDWYTKNEGNSLIWHWSPNYGFEKNLKVSGWNECLGTYIMAAASPTHGISKEVYTEGWARNGNMVNPGRSYYGLEINLARNWGGPLFWIHYAHHGINPKGLRDEYADYWQEHVNTAKIHYEYAKENPLGFVNYSEKCWGLTASDDPDGYTAHKPMDNDNGTISPTAALASMPYTPEESMKALKYFYRERGNELFGVYGPYDAFNDSRNWIKRSYIGIDQGPIVIMIENHRSGLLWKNVMKDPEIQSGLEKLGFQYEVVTNSLRSESSGALKIYPNPAKNNYKITLPEALKNQSIKIDIFTIEGGLYSQIEGTWGSTEQLVDSTNMQDGIYLIRVSGKSQQYYSKLLIQK